VEHEGRLLYNACIQKWIFWLNLGSLIGDKMLIQNEDGTFTAGSLDVFCILRDETTGRFHPAFFEESPLPGPVEAAAETIVVRLKSKMHHTVGFESLEEAVVGLQEELIDRIKVPETNICKEPIDWDGQIGIVWICSNWLKTREAFNKNVIGF
jgi:hypothetical protein